MDGESAELPPLIPELVAPRPLLVGRPNNAHKEDFLKLVDGLFERHWFTNNGQLVQEFEQNLAKYLNVPECVVVVNGTVALEIAIRALDLTGEIIVPAYTFIATAHAVNWQGLTPVFADIDPVTHTLDPTSFENAITPLTTAVIPVHLWGNPAQIEEIDEIARSHGLRVLYDAAHAFGVEYDGRKLGSFGAAEVFSFHSTKFFNSFEGGAITTQNAKLAAKMRLMRNFGFLGFDNVIHSGTNGKMTEVCAAMGLANLDAVDSFVAVNRRNYNIYSERISSIPGIDLYPLDNVESSNYQYVVIELDERLESMRDSLVSWLHKHKVIARKYFWPGAHRMEPYASTTVVPHLPNTEQVARRVVVLPTGTGVDPNEVHLICDLLSKWILTQS